MRRLALLVALTQPACVGYVAKSAYFQAELLAGRRPLERVLERGDLPPAEAANLALIPEIKAFGLDLGLKKTGSYTAVNADWKRALYTVTACPPLSFKPKTWWFPIVGGVPYLGFFRDEDAQRRVRRLERRGYETRVGRAGAYSTLGWFRDPVLPAMLTWSEADLSETVLHELAHATLWIRGSVPFNETFATVVGEAAADRYLEGRYGAVSPQLIAARGARDDYDQWRGMLREVYQELDALYQDPDLSDAVKLERKAAIMAGLPDRVDAREWADAARWEAAIRKGPWNNARLRGYRTYNTGMDDFERLLRACGGDVLAFIERVGALTKRQKDPYVALAAGADTCGG